MRPLSRTFALAAATVTALLLTDSAARAQDTYLAIGDSWAFGYSTAAGTVVNQGYDPLNPTANGYVGRFAQALDALNGAAPAPVVINLARPGETFGTLGTSFTDTTGPNDNALYNSRYLASPPGGNPSQLGLLQGVLATPSVASTIRNVTVQLGGNDVLGVVAADPLGWLGLSDAARQAAINTAVSAAAANMGTLLTQLRTALPSANIYVVGYADLFAAPELTNRPVNPLLPAFTYGDVIQPYTALGTQQSNIAFAQAVAQVAANVAGSGELEFLNLSADFPVNQLTTLSLIGTDQGGIPNFHLSPAGYDVVANRLVAAAAAVPESGTAGLLTAGLGGGALLLAVARRRRRPAALPTL